MTKEVEVGDEFTGKVVKTTTFGAFVELAKGTDGLLHISNVKPGERVDTVEDVLNQRRRDRRHAWSRSTASAAASACASPTTRRSRASRAEELAAVGTGDRGRAAAAAAAAADGGRDRGGRRRRSRRRRRPRRGGGRDRDRRERRTLPDGIELTELDSGVRVVTEAVPSVRSVALGLWVGTGSRDETPSAGRRLALPRAPAVQGHRRATRRSRSPSSSTAWGRGERGAPARRRRRSTRASSTSTSSARFDVLADMVLRADLPGHRLRARGRARGDRDVRGRARRTRSTTCSPRRSSATTRSAGRCSATRRGDRLDPGARDRRLPRRPLHGRRTSSSPRPGTSTTTQIVELAERHARARRRRRATARRRRPPDADGAAARASTRRRPSSTTSASAAPGSRATTSAASRSRVLDAILGGSTSSRLFQEVREKRGLAYAVAPTRASTPTPARSASTSAPARTTSREALRDHRPRARARCATSRRQRRGARARQGARQGPHGARRWSRPAARMNRLGALGPVRTCRCSTLDEMLAAHRRGRRVDDVARAGRASSTRPSGCRPPASGRDEDALPRRARRRSAPALAAAA